MNSNYIVLAMIVNSGVQSSTRTLLTLQISIGSRISPGGGANFPGGANIRFCQIFPKTASNRKNLGARRGGTPCAPPKSATANNGRSFGYLVIYTDTIHITSQCYVFTHLHCFIQQSSYVIAKPHLVTIAFNI